MSDTTAYTESIDNIIQHINNGIIMLPEFQRDFRWDITLTYDLFDSLARDIFIGTIIYGKPSFGISCRKLDAESQRGSRRKKIKRDTVFFSEEQIYEKVQSQGFKIILDGQQRITSLYRAIRGADHVFLILKSNATPDAVNLEEMMEEGTVGFGGEDSPKRICVSVHTAWEGYEGNWRDKKWEQAFAETAYYKTNLDIWNNERHETEFEIYRRAVDLLIFLFRREKLLSYYLLDMKVDKFCMFFERSNSRSIRLDFTDILAAKLYPAFNLRENIAEFEEQNNRIIFNKELIIRAISYYVSNGTQVDKTYILNRLNPKDFDTYWNYVCNLYIKALDFLYHNCFILSQDWMPSENMLLPLMVFFGEVGDVINEQQRRFIEFWFWASTFAARYSGSSNEVIIEDAKILKFIAQDRVAGDAGYLRKLRSRIEDEGDVLSYRKKASSIYKGLLNVVNYHTQGLLDWSSQKRLDFNHEALEDHHIFPRNYIHKHTAYKDNQTALDLVDCVANRALIPKETNRFIGTKPPEIYDIREFCSEDMSRLSPN